jgi:hypothetical protein
MDPRILELEYTAEHQHSDGSWSPLTEEHRTGDSADHDPERVWSLRRVFRCEACGETVALTPREDVPPPDAE